MCQIPFASFPPFSVLSGRMPRKSPRKRDVSQVCSQKRGKFAKILRGNAPKPEGSRSTTGDVSLKTAQIPANSERYCGKLTKIRTTMRCWSAKESHGTAKNVSPERQRRGRFSRNGGKGPEKRRRHSAVSGKALREICGNPEKFRRDRETFPARPEARPRRIGELL